MKRSSRREMARALRKLARKIDYPELIENRDTLSQYICDNVVTSVEEALHDAKWYLHTMGMGSGCYEFGEFGDSRFIPHERRQDARVIWLLFAALVIEEGAV